MPNNCQRCGACCADIGVPMFTNEGFAKLPEGIKAVVAFFFMESPMRCEYDQPCYFYDKAILDKDGEAVGGCLIHEHKPRVCREFEPNSEDCKRLRKEFLNDDGK